MESVFDHLVMELSRDERQELLRKIGEMQSLTEEPMRENRNADFVPLILNKEFSSLSFLSRIRIVIVAFLTGVGRTALVEKYLLKRIRRKVERMAPDYFDFNRGLVKEKMHQTVRNLFLAMEVFRRPLSRALESAKSDFYALLGKLEFEDIFSRLDTEIDPEKLAKFSPDALPVEIKRQMEERFEGILKDIAPERRRRMVFHMSTLARLRAVARYSYDRLLTLFPAAKDGRNVEASLTQAKTPLLELGDVLWAFRDSPSTTLLEALFLFDIRDTLSGDDHDLETELTDRMERAATALDVVRKTNAALPWESLLKVLVGDIQYSPRPTGGGEDWFRIFRGFWKDRMAQRFRTWSNQKRLSELNKGLTMLWGLEYISPILGYRSADFPQDFPLRHELSFAALRCLFLEVFPGRLYHVMNLVMMDGKFYKRDNRQEYEEVYGRFLHFPDKIRSIELKFRPEGEYGIRHMTIRQKTSKGKDVADLWKGLVLDLDRESQRVSIPIVRDLKAMSQLLLGILEGNGGRYDTLSNLSEIGGQGHSAFRKNLQIVQNTLDRSAELLSELISLEERMKPG